MVDPVTAVWLNRVGIILGFVSFWLVAPEFLGEERLKRWEERLEGGVRLLPKAADLVIFLLLTVWLPIGLVLMILGIVGSSFAVSQATFVKIVLGGALAMGVLCLTHEAIERLLAKRVAEPLLRRLADDEKMRWRYLVYGAFLFTNGTALQFLSTFVRNP